MKRSSFESSNVFLVGRPHLLPQSTSNKHQSVNRAMFLKLFSQSSRWWIVMLSSGMVIYIVFQWTQSPSCRFSFDKYTGHQYKSSETRGSICLVESKWMRLQKHTVQLAGQSNFISDWLWIDYHDRINVLVEAPRTSGDERQFYILEQTKYALEERKSVAIVGGIIEPGEDPTVAASREVEEELKVSCEDMIFLGRFRTDVNRGMGWVNSFLALHCRAVTSQVSSNDKSQVGAADLERQDLKVVTLTKLIDLARKGDFLEVQWSNTVALALLHPKLTVMNSN
jgi:8-oxo-dGTP pyrophosphatase MutT (NUDIX family)